MDIINYVNIAHPTCSIPDLFADNSLESQITSGLTDNGRSGSYSKDMGDDRHIPIIMLAAFVYDTV